MKQQESNQITIGKLAEVAQKRDENLKVERRPMAGGFQTKAWFK
jgi:hypothetical protein